MTNRPVYIGIDAGGSKTELLAARRQDEEMVTLFGSSANPARVGYDGCIEVLSDLITQALKRLGRDSVAGVCAGIAGAGRPREQRKIREGVEAEIADRVPSGVVIAHDAEIALEAAFEGRSGIIVIAGTGSVTLGRSADGEFVRAGGWGYLIGDEGSGFALGSSGLRALAHALDGGPETSLVDIFAEMHGIASAEDLVLRIYEEKVPLQQFAPVVIRAANGGDGIARQIVEVETRELARQVRWVANRCSSVEPQAALLGGLMNEAFYREAMEEALLEEMPGWKVGAPRNRPVVGAWRMARTAAANQAGAR